MKWRFVTTHTILQTEIPPITTQLGYKYTFCQNVVAKKKKLLFITRSIYVKKVLKCLSINDLSSFFRLL